MESSGTRLPIRLGLIGAGTVVASYHLPVLQTVAGLSLEWIVDPSLSRATELAKAYRDPTGTVFTRRA
jgi:predicted dehydrogenase